MGLWSLEIFAFLPAYSAGIDFKTSESDVYMLLTCCIKAISIVLFCFSNSWICLKCPGSSGRRFPLYRYRITLTITDCDTICDVSVFGTKLDLFFGVNANEFNRYVHYWQSKPGKHKTFTLCWLIVEPALHRHWANIEPVQGQCALTL